MTIWKNTIGRYTAHPSRVIKAKYLFDIQNAVKEAEQKGLSLRAVGSGHSYSDVAIIPPKGILLDMKEIRHFRIYPKNQRRPATKDMNLVEVGAGMTIRDLNKKLHKEKLGLKNMGGIDHQTISGAVSTGTHGTGIGLPSLPGMVRSIVLVGAGGKLFRIEPAIGITDPNFAGDSNAELIQDDKVFQATVLSLGCMGVIYGLVLEVDSRYWLKETKQLLDWEDVKPQIRDHSIHKEKNLRGVMVQVNPYIVEKRGKPMKRKCIVVKHYKIKRPFFRDFQDATRSLLPTIGNNPFIFKKALKSLIKNPSSAPKKIQTALWSVKDKSYKGRSYKVLYQGVDNIKEKGFDPEFGFRVGSGKQLDALEEMFKVAEEMAKKGIYQSSPMGLRWVDKSDALISPEHKGPIAYIDAPFLLGTYKADVLLDKYQEVMLKHDGIPHWGKINTILDSNLEKIKEYYTHLDDWKVVVRRFNPNGTFDNQFSRRLGLTT